ncbi:MAG: SPASM domain-containing protein [Planctomycetota bacterium]|jgi:radical SAM protein with 4Fe4S-binding SPASM domain
MNFEEATALMEKHLAGTSLLRESQRDNIRRKASDLHKKRLVWESTPVRIQLEPNRRCNIHCIHCDIPHPRDSDLDPGLIEKLFTTLGPGSMEVMPYLGGEPTLAPFDLLSPIMRKYNNYYSFTTNGKLCTGEFFRSIEDVTGRVTFSLFSHKKEVFETIVLGLPFEEIVQNAQECLKIAGKRGIHMLAGIVLMDMNFDSLPDWFEWVADLGYRHVGLTNLYPDTKRLDELGIYEKRSKDQIRETIARAMEIAGERGIFVETNVPEAYYVHFPENRPTRESPFDIFSEVNAVCSLFQPGFCPLVANMITIEYDGTVIACCRSRMPLGNLYEQDIDDIWNGPRMQKLRASFYDRVLYRDCTLCRDFFCDSAHPDLPAMSDRGMWWNEEYPEEAAS